MRSKSRFLRILFTGIVLVLFTGYFAFSTFFFSPIEGDYEFDVANLAPRDVDFFLAKADLRDDFAPFPRPAFADRLEASRGGQALLALPEVRDFLAGLDLQAAVDELERNLATLPIEVEPLELVGGEDLAVAGYLRDGGLDQADWAVYGRANWMGKLGVALLDHPGLVDLEAQGVLVSEEGPLRRIEAPGLARPLYVTRIRDVVIVGTDAEMVGKAHHFDVSRGQDSFGQSAKYADFITSRDREGDELEFYLDYRAFGEKTGLAKPWPDPASPSFGEALAARFVQLGTVRELVGMVGFGRGLSLRLHGMLSSERMTSVQKRLTRTRGFERSQVTGGLGSATLIPADVGLFAYLHVDVGDVLNEALNAAEPALVSNLEDLVRSVWGYQDLQPLIDDLEAALRNRVAVCIRTNDYPDDPPTESDPIGGPPHNDVPVPAWAVVLTLTAEETAALVDEKVMGRVEDIQKKIIDHQSAFSIQGREPGSVGVFTNTVEGGFSVYEYWSQLIDGTGHLSTVHVGDYFIVSNHHKMLGDMVACYLQRPGARRLADDPAFSSQVNTGLPSANVLCWLNPRAMGAARREMADFTAQDAVFIDWSIERPRLERKILKEHFPGETWGSLSPEIEEQVGIFYEDEAAAFERDFRAQHTPALRQRYEQLILASELLRGALFELSLGPKDCDVLLRLLIPFDDAEGA